MNEDDGTTLMKSHAIVPKTMVEVHQLAQAIAKSGMAPRGMETAEKITIAILHGLEIGLPPMQALQKIAVVNGKPTVWGDAAMALVFRSGLCEAIKETMHGNGDERVATCLVQRKGMPEPFIRAFSVHDAKKAKLWGKAGPWGDYPDRMMQMRARGFALRDAFADVLGGLYLREEIEEAPREMPPDPGRELHALQAMVPSYMLPGVAGVPAEELDPQAPPHDPKTGEITPPDPDPAPEPFLDEIIEHGDKVCKHGTEALQKWWGGFAPAVRSAIGRNRLELWKEKAKDADEHRG